MKYLVNFTRDYFKQVTLQSQFQVEITVGRTLPSIDNSTAVVTATCVGSDNAKSYHSQVLERKGSGDFNELFIPSLVVRPKKSNMSTYELLQL